jgi:iron complex transport system substrate-binding protein
VRIVSLLASATEIVAFLGLEDQIVGVSADSDWPESAVRGRAVLNTIAFDPGTMTSREIDAAASQGHSGASLYHVDADLLRGVAPDLVLTQEICDVCSVSRRDLDQAIALLGYAPTVVALNAINLEQVLKDIEQVAALAGVRDRSAGAVAALEARLARVRDRSRELPRARVLCLEWLDPPYCGGHWVPEMVDLAGGRDEIGTPSGPSREIAWREVVEYAPEVVVLMPCSLSLERVAAEFHVLRQMPGWQALPAVTAGNVYAGHTDLFSRSGPRLIDGVEVLARMLHPEVFEQTLADGIALKVAADGQRLEPYR